jgi:membrane protein implicated in regulation of membrane protease activity
MIELLTQNLLWWHWIILGLGLLTIEIFTATFMMLGLGLSAIIVGIIDVIYPLSLEIELILWMILSLLSIAIWFQYMRDKTKENSGQSNYSLETLGVVEEDIIINGKGIVRFDMPVLGNSTWMATAKENLDKNTRIRIVMVKGQLIEVASL